MAIYDIHDGDLTELERRMCAWAEEAGDLALTWFRRTGDLEFKAGREVVTEADRRIEQLLRERIATAYPDDLIVGEEYGGEPADASAGRSSGHPRRVWQVDPIDGTLNFALGLPEFCLSLAVLQGDTVLSGGVFQPISGDAFTASRGNGARRNGRPMRVSDRPCLADAVISPHLKTASPILADAALLQQLTVRPYKVRKMGAVALELAYVAAGWYDGLVASFGTTICLWDVAAGLLLVTEAGGRVSDLCGRPYVHGGPDLLAANPAVHGDLVTLLGAGD